MGLNTIRIDNPGDSEKCAGEMLQLWLQKKSDATWNQLIQTFREPHIKLEVLALNIESLLSGIIAQCYIHICIQIILCTVSIYGP